MTYQHHCTRALSQELFQPLYTLNVQMVCRLVKKQNVWFLQQNLCQFNTHTPSTRELRCRTFKVTTFKSQSYQCTLYLSLIILGTHHDIPLVFGGILLYQLQITLALIISTFGQLLVHLVQSFLHTSVVGKCLLGFFAHSGVVLQNHHLWQISYLGVVWYAYITCSRLL